MGLFDRLFKTNKEIKIKDDFEENYDNKIKCLYCETLISKDVKYCWKCGTFGICKSNYFFCYDAF